MQSFFGKILSWVIRNTELAKTWGPIMVSSLSLILGLIPTTIVIIFQRKQQKENNNNTLLQLKIENNKEIKETIIKQLFEFYQPIRNLRNESICLYRKFAVEEKKECQENGIDFRTLTYLVNGYKFNSTDKEILNEILSINEKINLLIESYLSFIEDTSLQLLLGKWKSHITILRLANNYQLDRNVDFSDSTFPREIDGAIESEMLRVLDKFKNLSDLNNSRKEKWRNSTIKYYDKNVLLYARKNDSIDLSSLYKKFESFLFSKYTPRILDAGCGTGRDTRYFISKGYVVISFDPSQKMVDQCNLYPFAYCKKMFLDEIRYKNEFDGIWCCAVLLHLKKNKIVQALQTLKTALTIGGVLFVSIKKGKGFSYDKGRYFQYYTDNDLREFFFGDNDLRLLERDCYYDKYGNEWINLFYRRIN
jgi:SAM-dependent methyltransferase